jgi:nickel/cobalt exporter
MNGLLAAHAAAFVLGAAHALEVDHMVAVSTFVGGHPRLKAAIGFGMRWGVGHALAVLVIGTVLAATGVQVPASWGPWTEGFVGVVLIVLGGWAVWHARRLHVHGPHAHGGHAHLHAHPPAAHPHSHEQADPTRRHRHLSSLVGAVHGLAGTAPVVALIPVTMLGSVEAAVTYLAAFGIGTVSAMALYAALAALALGRAAASVRVARMVAYATAAASGLVGVWWIVRSLRG